MGAIRKIEASLPKISIGGQAVGINTVSQALNNSGIAKPFEQAATVVASGVISTFTGMPVSPQVLNALGTGIKQGVVGGGGSAPAPAPAPAPTVLQQIGGTIEAIPTWQKVAAVLAVAAGAAYFMRKKGA